MEFIDASKSTLRKFSISMISELDVIVIFEGMKGLREFRVVADDGSGSDALEAMIVKDRYTNIRYSHHNIGRHRR